MCSYDLLEKNKNPTRLKFTESRPATEPYQKVRFHPRPAKEQVQNNFPIAGTVNFTQPERASTANYKFVPTREIFYRERSVCLVDDDKNALPRFDEES